MFWHLKYCQRIILKSLFYCSLFFVNPCCNLAWRAIMWCYSMCWMWVCPCSEPDILPSTAVPQTSWHGESYPATYRWETWMTTETEKKIKKWTKVTSRSRPSAEHSLDERCLQGAASLPCRWPGQTLFGLRHTQQTGLKQNPHTAHIHIEGRKRTAKYYSSYYI